MSTPSSPKTTIATPTPRRRTGVGAGDSSHNASPLFLLSSMRPLQLVANGRQLQDLTTRTQQMRTKAQQESRRRVKQSLGAA